MRKWAAETVNRVLTDIRIKRFFAHTPKKAFTEKLAMKYCVLVGGGCKYRGGEMKLVHTSMGITEPDFDAFLENAMAALGKASLTEAQTNDVKGRLEALRADVVDVRP